LRLIRRGVARLGALREPTGVSVMANLEALEEASSFFGRIETWEEN
jgi:hypothetical protein